MCSGEILKNLFYSFAGIFISSFLLSVLSDNRNNYSPAFSPNNLYYIKADTEQSTSEQGEKVTEVNKSGLNWKFKPITGIEENHDISEVLKKKKIMPPYYDELVSLGINLYWNEELESRYISYKVENNVSLEDAVTFVNIGMDMPRYSKICEIENPEALDVWVDKYRKLPEDYIPNDLKEVNRKYCNQNLKLRNDACKAFETMCEGAAKDGIKLTAVSAFRDYRYQEKVYFRYYKRNVPLSEYQATRDRVSARAGHSEHQTGLAVDVGCDEDNLLEESFEDTDAGKWVAENCVKYGFILRYPKDKEYITGYKYEPWHFRYLGTDLARKVYESGLTYDEFCARNLRDTNENRTYQGGKYQTYIKVKRDIISNSSTYLAGIMISIKVLGSKSEIISKNQTSFFIWNR